MKKILFLSILLAVFLSCAVNEKTGVIKVDNKTHSELKNLKIGETLIISSLAAGSYYDYWYYAPISGTLSSSNFETKKEYEGKELELALNMWVNVTAKYDNENNLIIEVSAEYHDSEETANEVWK